MESSETEGYKIFISLLTSFEEVANEFNDISSDHGIEAFTSSFVTSLDEQTHVHFTGLKRFSVLNSFFNYLTANSLEAERVDNIADRALWAIKNWTQCCRIFTDSADFNDTFLSMDDEEVEDIEPTQPLKKVKIGRKWGEMSSEEDIDREYMESDELTDSVKIVYDSLNRSGLSTTLLAAAKFFDNRISAITGSVKTLVVSDVIEVPSNIEEFLPATLLNLFHDLVTGSKTEIKRSELAYEPIKCKFHQRLHASTDALKAVADMSAAELVSASDADSIVSFIANSLVPQPARDDEILLAGEKASRFYISSVWQTEITSKSDFSKNEKYCLYKENDLEKFKNAIDMSYSSSRPMATILHNVLFWMVRQTVLQILHGKTDSEKASKLSYENIWATYFVDDQKVIERSYPTVVLDRTKAEFNKRNLLHKGKLKPKKSDWHKVVAVRKVMIDAGKSCVSHTENEIIKKMNLKLQKISSTVKKEKSLYIDERKKFVHQRINALQHSARVVSNYLASRKDELHRDIISHRNKLLPEEPGNRAAKTARLPITTDDWKEASERMRKKYALGVELTSVIKSSGLSGGPGIYDITFGIPVVGQMHNF